MSLRPVEAIGVAMRVHVGEHRRTAFVELRLGEQRLTMTQAVGRAVMAGIDQMLGVAERFDTEELSRTGQLAPERPTLSYSSDLTLTLDVVHDDHRDELLSVVAARIETILEREGADCWGWSLKAEPNLRQRSAEAAGCPEVEPEGNGT